MKKMFNKSLKSLFGLITTVLLAVSCSIGLGEGVDMEAPVLEVLSPVTLTSVPQSFEVKGTAKDNYGVTEIVVEISECNQKYKYTGSKWYKAVNESWEEYAQGNVNGSQNQLTWSVTVFIPGAKSAEDYTIITQAYDAMGNEGLSSKDERSVTMDIVEPAVSIIEPTPEASYSKAVANQESFSTEDNNVLSSLINGSFTISGYQKEDTTLSKLFVYLDDSTDEQISSYSEENDITKLIDPIFAKEINAESLRNWEVTVTEADLPSEYITIPAMPVQEEGESNDDFAKRKNKTFNKLIRLITESYDTAGNVERKVHGWFIYCAKADIPWIVADFGTEDYNSEWTKVYPSCTLQGQTYDDDGLSEVAIKRITYDSVNNTWDDDNAYISTHDLSSKGYPKYFAWSVSAISENKKFKVVVTAKDKNGVEAASVVKYMGITDTTPPTIKITSPVNGSTVISKKIKFDGYVQDDGNIQSLTMVRLQNDNKNEMLDYFTESYPGWDGETGGNKVFEIELKGDGVPVGGYVTKTFGGFRVKKPDGASDSDPFKNEEDGFDIFDDLGIDETEVLNTQNFIFKAVDNNGSATIESFVLQGDTEAPKLENLKVTVYNSAKAKIKDYPLDGESKTLDPFNKSGGKITDYIKISGTWSDNTYTEWKDLSKIGKIKLTVADKTYTITLKANGTWETDFLEPDTNSTCAITAILKDFGGNETKISASYYVNNSLPELVRISTSNDTPDGSYKVGDTINIVLEYNKKVTFGLFDSKNKPVEDHTPSGLVLTLNNGGKAYYDSSSNSNGSAKHNYKYVIGASDKETSEITEKVLSVKSIAKADSTEEWIDSDGARINDITKIPSGMNLNDLRTIVVDKTKPTVKSITAFTSGGYYKAGKEIFIQMEFSEDVIFSTRTRAANEDIAVTLTMNTEKTTTSTTKTSSKDLLFKYTVASDDSTTEGPLAITSIDWGDYTIVDKAGNELTKPEISASNNISSKGIIIDNSVPDTPVITIKNGANTLSDGAIVYNNAGAEITIDWGTNTGSEKKYSVDGGSSWSDWGSKTKEVLNVSGPYTVTAYQVNRAETESAHATSVTVTLDMGNILTSVSSTIPDGVYSAGKEIPVILKFRKPVTISADAKLELNISNSDGNKCYAELSDKTVAGRKEKEELKFTYTTKANDTVKVLKIAGFTYTSITDKAGNDISAYVPLPTETGYRLEDSRSIEVDTNIPAVHSVTLDESGTYPVLKIKFTSKINKGTGNIVIKQDKDSYVAPAYLTESQYKNYKKNATIASSYEAKVLGADENGKADLTQKYVLNFDSDTIDNSALKDAFEAVGALTVSVSVKSPVVEITGSGDTLSIPLKDNYKLPVKGADYSFTIPAGLVLNDLNKSNAVDAAKRTITPSGVETPVIRIEKKTAGFFNSVNDNNFKDLQTRKVKIDCQTPGATICYTKQQKTADTYKYVQNDCVSSDNIRPSQGFPTTPTAPAFRNNKYTQVFTVGGNDYTKGYKEFIRARATKDSGTTWSLDSYEVAFRTVVKLTDTAENPPYSSRWIRGGDASSGDVTTAGFPLSWRSTEYDKVKCMAKTGNDYYWITWDISTTLYVGFLAGDEPSDKETLGPKNWCWSSCTWVKTKDNTPVYPGESFTFDTSVMVNPGNQYDKYAYQDKHKESR